MITVTNGVLISAGSQPSRAKSKRQQRTDQRAAGDDQDQRDRDDQRVDRRHHKACDDIANRPQKKPQHQPRHEVRAKRLPTTTPA